MEKQTIYIEFDITREQYDEYEYALEQFEDRLGEIGITEISVQEIDQGEMTIEI